MKIYNPFKTLKKHEWALMLTSIAVVGTSGIIVGGDGILSTIASLLGVIALIFVAKGDAVGQALTICFSILYGIVSFKFKYYGEMITYLGMSAPAALVTLIVWLKNPYKKHEVKVSHMTNKKWLLITLLSIVITIAFYFILGALGTSNLIISTLSVLTSSFACLLLIARSPYYALAYSTNDIVLIILWVLATIKDIQYLPMILCFIMFLANDMYGFFNWRRMKKRQSK